MALSFMQRKTVNVHWTDKDIKGGFVSIRVEVGGKDREVRTTENDGYATITFPADFKGECSVTVKGSRSGGESGIVTVH